MVYSVTKAGMLSLTRSEAIDLARYGIRVNAISPGSVENTTIGRSGRPSGTTFLTVPKMNSGRSGAHNTQPNVFTSPQEIAELALFLCSERATNITGANFVIDGGLTSLLPER